MVQSVLRNPAIGVRAYNPRMLRIRRRPHSAFFLLRALLLWMPSAAVTGCSDDSMESAQLEAATKLERDKQYHEAVTLYESLLTSTTDEAMAAEIRFRLARCRIAGNDLNGALETLMELVEEDVSKYRIDVGEQLLELGDAFFAKGDRKKAQIAWKLGAGASPARMSDFNGRLEKLIDRSKGDGASKPEK